MCGNGYLLEILINLIDLLENFVVLKKDTVLCDESIWYTLFLMT